MFEDRIAMPREMSTPNVRRPAAVLELTAVTAAILAGGLGSRLRPVVSDCPKALANIGERPFLTYLFDQLVAAGAKDVVLCTGYLGDQIRMIFGKSYDTLRLNYSQESTALGTAGALRLALPLFNSNPVLVMNGDSYCDANIREFWFWHGRRQSNATLLLTKIFDTERFGQVMVDADGKVTDFEEKSSRQGPGWINAGIYLLNRDLLEEIPPNRPVSLEREIFPAWIGRGLYGFQSEARFIDIGTPEAYAGAQSFFAAGLPR
jgi:D-glycero-alpha-D-manno-heptose 1-phosphate guanylyltransferase